MPNDPNEEAREARLRALDASLPNDPNEDDASQASLRRQLATPLGRRIASHLPPPPQDWAVKAPYVAIAVSVLIFFAVVICLSGGGKGDTTWGKSAFDVCSDRCKAEYYRDYGPDRNVRDGCIAACKMDYGN